MTASRVLVTGATGFVGGALVERLLSEDGWIPAAGCRQASLVPLRAEHVLTPSLASNADWSRAVYGVDVVVHAAARVHVMNDAEADPLTAYRKANVAGTLALARQAAQAGVKRFVFVSSIKVNGERTRPGDVFRETDRPAPEDPYGISKAEAEAGLFAIGRDTGMEIVVVRPPLVYGPGVKGNFAQLLCWVRRGVPLPLGAVNNRRSLVGLDNLIDLLVKCLDHPRAAGKVFLVSDGEDLSTTGLLKKVAAALGQSALLMPVPPAMLRAVARLLRRPVVAQRLLDSLQIDMTFTQETLAWNPPMSVDEELRRTVAPFLARQTKG
jgi:nucleoside-diphosphate-sugar epimerase